MRVFKIILFCCFILTSHFVSATEYGWEKADIPVEPIGYNSKLTVFNNKIYSLNQNQLAVSAEAKQWESVEIGNLELKSNNYYNLVATDSIIAFAGNYNELIYSSDGVTWKKSSLSTDNSNTWVSGEYFYFTSYQDNELVLMKTSDFITSTEVVSIDDLTVSFIPNVNGYYIQNIKFSADKALFYFNDYGSSSNSTISYFVKTQDWRTFKVTNATMSNTYFNDFISIDGIDLVSFSGENAGVYKLTADGLEHVTSNIESYNELHLFSDGINSFAIDQNGKIAEFNSATSSLNFTELTTEINNISHVFDFDESIYIVGHEGIVVKLNADMSEIELVKKRSRTVASEIFNGELLTLKHESDIDYNSVYALEAYNFETKNKRVLFQSTLNSTYQLFVNDGLVHLLGWDSFFTSTDGEIWIEASYDSVDYLNVNEIKALRNKQIVIFSFGEIYSGTSLSGIEQVQTQLDDGTLYINYWRDIFYINGTYYASVGLSDNSQALISSSDLNAWVTENVFENGFELYAASDTELLITTYDENFNTQPIVFDTVISGFTDFTFDFNDSIYSISSFYIKNKTFYSVNSNLYTVDSDGLSRELTPNNFYTLIKVLNDGDDLYGINNNNDLLTRKPLSEIKDTDGDGLNDLIEEFIGSDPFVADADDDFDRDGLTNAEEYYAGSYIYSSDSDRDSLTDGQEIALGTDPTLSDTDGDGILDYDDSEPNNANVTALVKKIQDIKFESEVIKQCITDSYSLDQSVYDVSYFYCWAQSDVAIKNINDLNNFKFLTGIQIPYTQVENWEVLQKLEFLTNFEGYKLTDEALELLVDKVNIERVSLRNSTLSNLVPLATLPKLLSLDMYRSTVEDWQELKNLKLTELYVRQSNFTDASLVSASVKYLDASHTHIENLSLGSFNQLESLRLWFVEIDDWSFLSSLTHLTDLDAGNSNFTNLNLINGDNLTSLELSYTQVTDWTNISELKLLNSLYLNNTSFNDLSLLEGMELYGLALSDTDVLNWELISSFKGLRSIYLDGTSFSDLSLIDLSSDHINMGLSSTQVDDLSPLFAFSGNYLSVGVDNIPLVDFTQLDTLDSLSIRYYGQPIGLEDFDGDGIPDIIDEDDDNDGMSDEFELQYGFYPYYPQDAGFDFDGDGLTNLEEMQAGTDPTSMDTDNDGISDYIELTNGSDPLDSSSTIGTAGVLSLFNDTNADGVLDWISYKEDEQHTIVKLYSGDNFDLLNEFTITYPFDSVVFYTLQDRDFDDVEELGVFGFDSSKNRYQLLVHSGSNGAKLGAWNWPATLSDVSFEVLSDLTGDGVEEYAISGVHLSNGTRQLVVKDGMTRGNYQTFKWPNQWDSPKYVVMTDITSDGIPEVAMHGKHERLDKGQLFMYDGANANSKLDVYNWNPLWDDISLHQMDDLDGDGTTDWGQFGKRKDDGRYQWLVKKGNDKRGVIRTFSWPNDLINVKPLLVSDRTNDGIRDVAIVGTHPTTDKVFLRINDGRLANQRITNFSWPGNWEDTQVVELGDLNNDGFNEFALLGYTKTNRAVQVVVKDGRLTTEYGRYTLPGKWEGISLSHYDTNNDGVEDIVISGISQTQQALVLTSLDGKDLTLLGSQIIN